MNKLDEKLLILKEIIRECVMNDIEVTLRNRPASYDGLAYEVTGFAKSGKATVFVDSTSGNIEAHLRYDKVETVEDFEALARISYYWFVDYKDRGYTPGAWAQVFERFGWIKKKVSTEWEIV